MAGLFQAVEGRTYAIGQEQKLLSDLAVIDRATRAAEPARWQDLSLTPAAITPDGHRFTEAGFAQVCALLAPGLARLVLELSGGLRSPHEPLDGYSLSDALAVYNMVLRRRFATHVAGRCRIVRDVDASRIDGVVGVRSTFLDNRTLARRTLDAAEKSARGLVFFEAHLLNRRLALRLLDRKGLARAPDGVVWHSGWWIASGELGDDASLCGRRLLAEPKSGLCALGPAVRGRNDRDAARRLDALLAALDADSASRADVVAAFERLQARTVPMPADASERIALVTKIAGRLARKDVPLAAARRAVVAATLGGGDAEFDRPVPVDFDGRATRRDLCYLSLYKALSRMAKSRHVALRERLERAAYTLLNPNNQAAK